MELRLSHFIGCWDAADIRIPNGLAWEIVPQAEALVRSAIQSAGADYRVDGDGAVHRTATIEAGAVLKPPFLIGPRCFVAGTAYLRGGIFLDQDCIVGPACELKSSFLFRGSKLAHLNFVGDSILGESVNVEAGAIIANYRNELTDKRIRFHYQDSLIETGVDKFGALVGDRARIGANAVIAPGAVIDPDSRIARLALVDMYPSGE